MPVLLMLEVYLEPAMLTLFGDFADFEVFFESFAFFQSINPFTAFHCMFEKSGFFAFKTFFSG